MNKGRLPRPSPEGYHEPVAQSFPNLYGDSKHVQEVAEWPSARIDDKMDEYGAFLQREDLMPRARQTASHILDMLLFESAYRDGVYER